MVGDRMYSCLLAPENPPPHLPDSLPCVFHQLLHLVPKLRHAKDIEERGDTAGQSEVNVDGDVVGNLVARWKGVSEKTFGE